LREEGVIVGVEGERVRVRIERSDACSRCRVCVPMGDGSMVIEAKNARGAGVGDRVRIEVDDSRHLRAAFMVYILPLIGLIAGYLTGTALAGSEKVGFLLGAGVLMVIFLLLHCYDRKVGTRDQSWPEVVERLTDRPGLHCGGNTYEQKG